MGQPQTSSTTQQSGPGVTAPYLNDLFSNAANLYKNYTPTYSGPQVAGFNPNQTTAQGMLTDYAGAGGAGQGMVNNTLGSYQNTLGSVLNPNSNPDLQGAVQASTSDVARQFQTQTAPSISSYASGAGAGGGSREALAQGVASGEAQRSAMNTAAGMYNTQYQQGLNTYGNLIGQAGNMFNLGAAPATAVGAVGQQQQQQQQQQNNAAAANATFEQMLPYLKLAQYQSILSGDYGGTGTSTQTTPNIWSLFGLG